MGASCALGAWLDLPMSATTSYRFQRLAPEPFEEVVHLAGLGLYYHLVDAF